MDDGQYIENKKEEGDHKKVGWNASMYCHQVHYVI